MAAPVFLDIRKVAATNITRSTIGFLDCSGDVPKSLGSATFVQFGNVPGLLTCAHVAYALEERAQRGEEDIGIVMFPARKGAIQNTLIKVSHLKITRIGDPPFETETGPDIAFIALPAMYAGTLQAQASIVNGDLQSERSRTPQPQLETIEVVAGVVAQWITTESKGDNRILARVEALGTTGRLRSQRDAEGYDTLEFDIEPDQQVTLPETFGGTSGGGIWRLFYELDGNGDIVVKERRLTGVAFFEKPGQIIGHGPTTIYRHLIDRLSIAGRVG
jgi:hypothetical protein